MYNKNTCYSPALGKPSKKEQTCSFYAMEPNTSFLVCGELCVYNCQIKVTLVNQKHQIPPHLQEKMSVVAGCLSLALQLEMESIEYHHPWD